MTLMAVFQTLLYRYSSQEDFAVGTPAAGRLRPETEDLIGYFINTLAVRADLSGDPAFRDLLARVRKTSLEAFDNQELPFERLVQEINPPRDLSRHPLFQVMFVLHNTPQVTEDLPELQLSALDTGLGDLAADFDLTMVVNEGEQGIHVSLDYRTDLFDEATVVRMLEQFELLLERLVIDPDQPVSQLPLLNDQQRHELLVDWNRTDADASQLTCVHQMFETQAAAAPGAIATVFDGQTQTYGQLNAQANRLAHYLQGQGVGSEALVGICLERSSEMLVALIAILKAGGAYVPLDPDYPRQRIDFVAADSRPAVVLTTSQLANRFTAPDARVVCLDTDSARIADCSEANISCTTNPNSAMCVLYTSGSTGQPKGVVLEHRGIANYLLYWKSLLRLDSNDRVLFKTPLGFDVSIEEVFGGLSCGACIVVAKEGGHREADYLAGLCANDGVTTASFVPTMLRTFLEESEISRCRLLKKVTCGGEILPPDLVDLFFERLDAELFNLYGPTEASISVTAWRCRREDQQASIPIGRPLPNVRTYILDERHNPVPIGVPGELYIGGMAVARGYLNRPELTAQQFIPDPFNSGLDNRLYRTGDLCRYLPDGNIAFVGRKDGQVKISGVRIELEEVEAALTRHSAVAQAAVVDRTTASGSKYLAAYLVVRERYADSDATGSELAKELRSFLRSSLADSVIPQAFHFLTSLPQLNSGKVDRAALPDVAAAPASDDYIAPQTDVEKQLAAIWCEVLHRGRIGTNDNFFEHGGHSLLAVRAMVRAREALGVRLPVATMFVAPTIAEMAEHIEAVLRNEPTEQSDDVPHEGHAMQLVEEIAASLVGKSAHDGQSLAPLRTGGTARPLFCIHGLGGHIAAFFPLARGLTRERPVYGLQGQGLDAGQQPHDRIEDMAAFYLDEIRQVQPHGPYLLAGWSMGGIIALEMSQQLAAVGETVDLLAMFDTYLSIPEYERLDLDEQSVIRWIAPQLNIPAGELKKLSLEQQWQRIADAADLADGIGVTEIRRLAAVCKAHLAACATYRPKPHRGRAILFQAGGHDRTFDRRWKKLCPALEVETAAGDHYSMLRKPNVDALAERLDKYLAAADAAEFPRY